MSSLFESDTASKYNAQQTQMIKKQQKKALKEINTDPIVADLTAEKDRLQKQGLLPVSYTGPGHFIGFDSGGNITMNRTGEAQGFMDKLLSGMATDEAGFGSLLSQIAPGFGRLTMARGQEIDNARDRAVGNLREQLAKRRVLGASFANDQIGSLERQYMLDKDKALAESIVQEMEMTNQVIQARSEARNKAISTGLAEIQFETGVGAQLTQSVSANLQNLQTAMTDLVKLAATISAQGQIAKGNISANLGNTGIASQTDFANLESQEAAGFTNFLGTAAGAAAGAYAASDARIKENIAKIGTLIDGINIYKFNFTGSALKQVGVMAQEVELIFPNLVREIDGIKHVNYAGLMERV